jgi:hypothetical protein
MRLPISPSGHLKEQALKKQAANIKTDSIPATKINV